jgi:hypothetical protein
MHLWRIGNFLVFRVFALIENSVHHHTRGSDSTSTDRLTRDEATMEECLLSTVNSIMRQCSLSIYKVITVSYKYKLLIGDMCTINLGRLRKVFHILSRVSWRVEFILKVYGNVLSQNRNGFYSHIFVLDFFVHLVLDYCNDCWKKASF